MSLFDFDIDFRFAKLRFHWRLWVVEPIVEAEPQPRGDVFASAERADTWSEPERRMGFTANTPT